MKFSNLLKKASSILLGLGLTFSPVNAHLGCKIMTAVHSVVSGASGLLFASTYTSSGKEILEKSLDQYGITQEKHKKDITRLIRIFSGGSTLNSAYNAWVSNNLNKLHNENHIKLNSKA